PAGSCLWSRLGHGPGDQPHNAAHGMAMQIRRCHHARAAHVWRRGGGGGVPARTLHRHPSA
ncbi:hypothetical protein, partial [Komagataeibacter kakiaceti]|uniref:hypothetical protein n=1 Tax=Komagataeibacter kakiaceti TaxID=943261 RepID=UPI001A7EA271